MKFQQIEAFRAVMMSGSMTAAAARLNTSQPGISRRIAQLERDMKLRLFERGTHRLEPTAEAVALLREIERTFSALDTLTEAARAIRSFSTGTIRIACLPSLGLGFLPQAIARFNANYPDIAVSLQIRSSSTVVEWTASHQCDLGIVAKGVEVKGVEVEPFVCLTAVCVLPPGHRLAGRKVIHAADLENEEFISLGPIDPTRSKIDRLFDGAAIPRRLRIETQYAATVCACVVEGLGVAVVNPLVPQEFIGRGLVVRPFLPEIRMTKLLIYPRNRPSSALVDAFVDELKRCRDQTVKPEPADRLAHSTR